MPLVTTAAGTKFGKTEAGAVWLDPALTSPYEFYQFWLNVDDRDAARYARYFTFLSAAEIEELERASEREPERRQAQRQLAREVTRLVHGAGRGRRGRGGRGKAVRRRPDDDVGEGAAADLPERSVLRRGLRGRRLDDRRAAGQRRGHRVEGRGRPAGEGRRHLRERPARGRREGALCCRIRRSRAGSSRFERARRTTSSSGSCAVLIRRPVDSGHVRLRRLRRARGGRHASDGGPNDASPLPRRASRLTASASVREPASSTRTSSQRRKRLDSGGFGKIALEGSPKNGRRRSVRGNLGESRWRSEVA